MCEHPHAAAPRYKRKGTPSCGLTGRSRCSRRPAINCCQQSKRGKKHVDYIIRAYFEAPEFKVEFMQGGKGAKKRKEDRKRQNVGWNWEGKSGTHEMSTVFLLFLGAAFLVVAFVVLALAFAVVFAFFAAGAFKCSMNIRIRGRVSMRWIPRI